MLEPSENCRFLFEITNQIKDFYETTVIFITGTDFSDPIFNTLCSARAALEEGNKDRLADVVVEFHLQWLRNIIEIENFMNGLTEDFRREKVYKAICFTIDAIGYRLKYLDKYMENYRSGLSNESQANIQTDLEIIEEMHKEVAEALLEKVKDFKNPCCFEEFKVKVNEAIDLLLDWLDKNYDGLAIRLSNYMHVMHLESNLSKPLQHIVGDLILTDQFNPATAEMLNQLKKKGKPIGSLIRRCVEHKLELRKVLASIDGLKETIEALADQEISAPLMALIHKKQYLENRVNLLEKSKTTLESIQKLSDIQLEGDLEECPCPDFYQLKVFNHILPLESRENLVTDLCRLWNLAIFGERSHESVVSILSVTGVKEEFTDDLGTFYIDEYSRKIYKSTEDGETLLQPNEHGELVRLSDDMYHIYFYDDCGRYYIEEVTRDRVYKAHASNSEYKMNTAGVLLKVKEIIDGTEYYYDRCGRYYINDKGKRIYCEEGHLSEYENDDLGNIVRIRSQLDIFQPCPDDEHVSEDFKYLKLTVGPALRICIADLLLHQPADPIKYLSTGLVHFRETMELKDRRLREKEELDAEREIKAAEARAEAERLALEAMTDGGSEASYDSNLVMYTSKYPEEPVTVGGASSK
ncbi:hypothetical protein PYW08_004277 [Mythimna loreyi]|uniref:Uncharacterized protein n=1 Tax=Mythimna loreyi TaxID=667449 RepID=A0ACC2QNE2_9NEOP|nr:hypothetical protein PYW08_004277 [Mythimna loreyi]